MILAVSTYGCTNQLNYDSNYYCEKYNYSCEKDRRVVVFLTTKGPIKVELYGDKNPLTVSNFIKNINENSYNNRSFYKIINFPSSKVVHSGIFAPSESLGMKKLNSKNHNLIPLEVKLNNEQEPRYKTQIKDPKEIENLSLVFEKGSLAMVKARKNYSSRTEFFFTISNFYELDGRYSLFGKVIQGLDVLQKIDKTDFIKEIKIDF